MRGLPLALGASGEAVRDLQIRLAGAGWSTEPDAPGEFEPGTEDAVRSFQEQVGLTVDGVVGTQTWSALVEAGYRLGDRRLYLRAPMLRGDDVAELQRRLNALGFHAGRVDGIFGPDGARALEDFQRNAGLNPDAICGADSVAALERLGAARLSGVGVAGVRERERLLHASRDLADRRIVVGETGGLASVATAVTRALRDAGAVADAFHHPDWSFQARAANDFEADVFVGLRSSPDARCDCAFFQVPSFESIGGRRLAELATQTLHVALGVEATSPRGMRLPILRETRMPAVLCSIGPPERLVRASAAVADAIVEVCRHWVRDPLTAS